MFSKALTGMSAPGYTEPMENEKLHIHILSRELDSRVSKNPQYSLRSFARNLGVAPSWISDVLNGKKGISVNKASDLCRTLGFTRQETEVFVLSVQAAHARRISDRDLAQTRLNNLSKEFGIAVKIKQDDLALAGSWYHQAILELTELEEFDHTEAWLAKKLNLSPKLISSAIQRLVTIGWLKIQDGKMQPQSEITESSFDIPSQAIKNYHREILEKAQVSLSEDAVDEREFLSMTLGFDSRRMQEAKEDIRKFQAAFAEKYFKDEKKDSVHQLSVQFFRVDKKKDVSNE